ncbi:MAG: hypothetical protein JXA25_11420 [Anaerolineales bacterium]|nr:hypothetical protein [Anaerolineales bacterium]
MNGNLLCAGGLVAFLIVFGLIAFLRYLRHKEIIALAEQGLPYPKHINNGKDMLRWGISIVAIGLALLAGAFPLAIQNAWALTLIGLIPVFFGLALLLVYVLTQMDGEDGEELKEESIDIIDAIEEDLEE